MCLHANKSTTDLLKKLPLTGKLTVYKVFSVYYTLTSFKTCQRLKEVKLTGRYRTEYKYTPGDHAAVDAKIDTYN